MATDGETEVDCEVLGDDGDSVGGGARLIGADFLLGSCGTRSSSSFPPASHAVASCAESVSKHERYADLIDPQGEKLTTSEDGREQVLVKVHILTARDLDGNGNDSIVREDNEPIDLGLHEMEG